jgi:hypothetical protein
MESMFTGESPFLLSSQACDFQLYLSLDGDNIRTGLNRDLGFSKGDRAGRKKRTIRSNQIIGLFQNLFVEWGSWRAYFLMPELLRSCRWFPPTELIGMLFGSGMKSRYDI